MLRPIVHQSTFPVTFFVLLRLSVARPQRRHLSRIADAIIVCEGREILGHLYRQWAEAPDVSAVAYSLRVSPWAAEDVSQALWHLTIADMPARAEKESGESIIWASTDDSATRKDKDTHAPEAADWTMTARYGGRTGQSW